MFSLQHGRELAALRLVVVSSLCLAPVQRRFSKAQQDLGILDLSSGFCLPGEKAPTEVLPAMCWCCATLLCCWEPCSGVGAATVSVAAAISMLIRSCCELPVLQLEGGHGRYMLLYPLKSVYLNQCASNGVMCFWNELGRQQER